MTTTPVAVNTNLPSTTELLAQFGDEYLSINSLFQFSFVPGGRLSLLKDLTLEEDWGTNNFVLLKYLAVHVRLAIEQERYVWNGDQIVMTAGSLTTTRGTPIFVGLVKNAAPEENPWVMNWIGERPRCAELPQPANLGEWPELDPAKEVLIVCDLSDEERRERLPVIGDLPVVAQMAALSGALDWSMRRGLGIRQIHGGGRGWFVPLHLQSRENLTVAPDLVAPVLVQGERLAVRAFLEPHVAYSPARAVVERWEQLPPWMLDAWEGASNAGGLPIDHDSEGPVLQSDELPGE
ncbi:MAG: hypothetical protein ACI8QS_000171 [Planctomycetota bacterium]|jgi:hypothetical protein